MPFTINSDLSFLIDPNTPYEEVEKAIVSLSPSQRDELRKMARKILFACNYGKLIGKKATRE